MRKISLLFFIFLLMAVAASLQASEINAKIRELIENLHQKPELKSDIKRGLILDEFEEKSQEASSNNLGSAIRQLLLRKLADSNIFSIIDETSTKKILKELELRQQGVVSGSEDVDLKAADFLLKGTITEIAENFAINLSLVKISSRESIITVATQIAKNELLERAHLERIQYVTQHSIGTTIDYKYFNGRDNNNKGFEYGQIGLNYRFSRQWLSSFGVLVPFRQLTQVYYEFGAQNQVNSADILQDYNKLLTSLYRANPGIDTKVKIDDFTENVAAGILFSKLRGFYQWSFEGSGIGASHTYAWNINRYFSLGFGLGANIFFNPEIRAEYHLIPHRIGIDSFYLDRAVIEIRGRYPIVAFQGEIKPEIFITPRLTLRLNLGFTLATKFVPKDAKYKDSLIVSKETNSVGNRDEGFFELFGLNPFIDPDETSRRVGPNFNGYHLGFGVGFWF